MPPGTYPPARRGADADVLGADTIPDPYRWMEDPASPETKACEPSMGKGESGGGERVMGCGRENAPVCGIVLHLPTN